MVQMITENAWNDEFGQNPWSLGGLIVVVLFVSTFLFFVLFAIMFGYLYSKTETQCEE